MTTLMTVRDAVRQDLRDTDPAAYKWSDAELDRHIARALAEHTRVAPLIASTMMVAGPGALYDLSATEGWLWCERVEYPMEASPRQFLSFEEATRGQVFLLAVPRPPVGASVRFWYARSHTLDATTSTVPYEHASLIALGAVAYALLAYADYAIGRVGASSWDPRHYRDLGLTRLREFTTRLDALRQSSGWTAPLVSWEYTG